MFEEVSHRSPSGLEKARLRIRAAARVRLVQWVGGGAMMALGGCALLASGMWYAAGPARCAEIPQAEMSLNEILTIKDRVTAYERDNSGSLTLSAKEASFILADNLKYPLWLEADGDQLSATLAVPERDRCWNIAFTGAVSVDSGVAQVQASSLQVGALDLSAVAAGRSMSVRKRDIKGRHARRLLGQTRKLRVSDGQLVVELDDPSSLR